VLSRNDVFQFFSKKNLELRCLLVLTPVRKTPLPLTLKSKKKRKDATASGFFVTRHWHWRCHSYF
jgi:hypothetical protein